jgi:CheY-like chemotaxis protein
MAKILVIDDSDSIRTLLRDLLERDGHQVVTAETGHDGEEALGLGVDACLCDGKLPWTAGGDAGPYGYQLCCTARALGIPVALVSGDLELVRLEMDTGLPTLPQAVFGGGAGGLVRRMEAEIPASEPDPEPEIDDTVRCCPDCEGPNQFGEVCTACLQERELEHRDPAAVPA